MSGRLAPATNGAMPVGTVRRGPIPGGRLARSAVHAAVFLVVAGPLRLAAQGGAPAPRVPPTPPASATPTSAARTSLTGVALSAAQRAAIGALGGRTHAALQSLYTGAGVRPGAPMALAVRDSAHSLMVGHNAALRALLADDQRAVFEANVQAVTAAHRAARADSARHRRITPAARAEADSAAGARP